MSVWTINKVRALKPGPLKSFGVGQEAVVPRSAASSEGSKQHPLVYGAALPVVDLEEGPRPAVVQESPFLLSAP